MQKERDEEKRREKESQRERKRDRDGETERETEGVKQRKEERVGMWGNPESSDKYNIREKRFASSRNHYYSPYDDFRFTVP